METGTKGLTQVEILVVVNEFDVTDRGWLETGPVPTERTP